MSHTSPLNALRARKPSRATRASSGPSFATKSMRPVRASTRRSLKRAVTSAGSVPSDVVMPLSTSRVASSARRWTTWTTFCPQSLFISL